MRLPLTDFKFSFVNNDHFSSKTVIFLISELGTVETIYFTVDELEEIHIIPQV